MTEPIAQTEPRPRPQADVPPLGALQRLLAFGALIVLFVGFSLGPELPAVRQRGRDPARHHRQRRARAGVTFVIITGGIDLSIGTVMTSRRDGRGVHHQLALPVPLGILAGLVTGTLAGIVNGT